VIEEVGGAAADPAPSELVAEPCFGFGEGRGDGSAVAVLEVGDDLRFIGAEAGDVAALAPAVGELLLQLNGILVDPRRLCGVGEADAFWFGGDVGLQAPGESRLLEDELLHEAEDRRADCILLQLAVDVGDLRDAGATGALGAVDDRDVAAGAAQVVGGDEAIDAGTDDDDRVGN
jgi:hypothetical protein